MLPGDRWERQNEERVKDSRGGLASSLADRHGREVGSGPAPYLQFQSAVLTAAATLGRGRGGGSSRAEKSQPTLCPVRWGELGEGDGIGWRDRCGPTNLILYPFPRGLGSPPGKYGPQVCLPSISLAWGLSAGPDPKGSHVFPGSPQVLSRAGAAGLGCRRPGDESCGAASGSFPRLGTGS